MGRVNRCTGEAEYRNGCTNFGYAISTASVGVLILALPTLHFLYFSDLPPATLLRCLTDAHTGAEAHAKGMSLYFRYQVEDRQECSMETRLLRGCVANATQAGLAFHYS